MKNKLLVLLASLLMSFSGFSQPCTQPGSLVSVKYISDKNVDYIVFQFLNPYSSKGTLGAASPTLFPYSIVGKNSYHKIVFENVPYVCYNTLSMILPGKRLIDFKTEQRTATLISYVFELAEGTKITKHYVTKHGNNFLVKIKIHK